MPFSSTQLLQKKNLNGLSCHDWELYKNIGGRWLGRTELKMKGEEKA